MTMTDEELLVLGRNGENSAFSTLVERYQKPLHNFLFGMVKHREDTADLVQQVFFLVYRKAEQFRQGTLFRAWLFAIARNTGKNHHQTNVRQRNKDHMISSVSAGDAQSCLNSIINKQNTKNLLSALKQLPPKQKLTIELRTYRDFTIDEIACIMGVTIGATKANLHHGLNRLKQILDPDYAMQ